MALPRIKVAVAGLACLGREDMARRAERAVEGRRIVLRMDMALIGVLPIGYVSVRTERAR